MNATTDDNENANELKFGDEFSDVMSLSIDAIYLLLEKRQKLSIRTGLPMNEAFEQTFAYVERIATTKVIEDLEALTEELEQKLQEIQLERIDDRSKKSLLHSFESASLANLIKDDDVTAEEIRSLLPSLSRFPIDQLELVISIVADAKGRAAGSL